MNKPAIICLLMCLPLGGCVSGTVSASNIKPAVDKVVAEHAEYVAADIKLSAEEKTIKTRTGQWLKQAVDEAATPVGVQ